MTDYTSQIDAWYQAIQFRAPPAAELASFNAQLQAGVLTTAQAINQIEVSTYTMTYVNPVIQIYQAALDRVPDQGGESYWVNAFATGAASLSQIATIFANSAEFEARYGASATTPSSPTLVTALYNNILGRTPDAQGLAYWSSQNLDAAQLLQAFSTSAEFQADTAGPIQVYQNLEVLGTEPTTGTLFQTALQPPPGSGPTYILTTGQDKVGPSYTTVTGTAGAADQTLTDGDSITGVPGVFQTIDITTVGSSFAPGVATINGAHLINITAAASNTYNALQWSNVPTIDVIAVAGNNTVTGIANAPIATTYELSGGANTASLVIGFSTTGAGSFGLLGTGISATAPAYLDATGTVGVNGLANALTGATIATSGTNYDVINLGTNDASVTITGTGTDTFTFGQLAKTVALDFTAASGSQTLTFAFGQINGLSIEGNGDYATIIAPGFTGCAPVISGVDYLYTTFAPSGAGLTSGNVTFDGTHVVGLTNLTIGSSAGNDTFINMTGTETVNIVGQVVPPNPSLAPPTPTTPAVQYSGTAADAGTPGLANGNSIFFNFIDSGAAATFNGLEVTNEQTVAVNFDLVGGFIVGSAVGEINVDNIFTTGLTINNVAANTVVEVAVGNTSSLQNFTVETLAASAANTGLPVAGPPAALAFPGLLAGTTTAVASTLHVTNLFVPVVIDTALANVHVYAAANGSTAWLSGVADPSSFGFVNVEALGTGSTAILGEHFPQVPLPFLPFPTGGAPIDLLSGGVIQEVTVQAEGNNSNAFLTHFASAGAVGTVNVLAQGNGAFATIDTATVQLGGIQTVNVISTGVDATATLELIDPLSIGTVNVEANSTGDVAVINHIVGLTGNIQLINVSAAGQSSFAGIIAPPPLTVLAGGDLNTVDVTASGNFSAAALIFPAVTFSDVGQVNVTASGTDSFAIGWVIAVNSIQTATLTASGVGSLAIEILDPLHIGTVTVTTGALGDGTPDFTNIPFVVPKDALGFFPTPLVVTAQALDPFSFTGAGTESTAILSLADFQITNGGVVNAGGAGFFDFEQTAHGGFTVNANNTGGFSYLTGFSAFTDDHWLTTTINSASNFNFIQAGVEQMVISTAVAVNPVTGSSTPIPGAYVGNTFDMGTAVSPIFDPFGNGGAGVTSGAQFFAVTAGNANETIKAGFTQGGTNAFGSQGQLTLSFGSGTAANFLALDPTVTKDANSTDFVNSAIAATTLAANAAVHYVEEVIGGNTWIAVDKFAGLGAGSPSHVLQVIELTGVTGITFHDIHF